MKDVRTNTSKTLKERMTELEQECINTDREIIRKFPDLAKQILRVVK